jgi:sirohydrochlorin cobaltochelatase
MTSDITDLRAPMASAPMRYLPDGSVDWGTMWDSFCVLARDGGPPHRSTLLMPGDDLDPASDAYQAVVREIVRGIAAVSGLSAVAAEPGWVAVRCHSPEMARWLSASIEQENVAARSEGDTLFVPAAAHFTVKGEIKNVITAVAKTTHYWWEHLPPDVKRALLVERRLREFTTRLRGWLFGERIS